MAGIQRFGATPNYNDTAQRQRLGNDSVYGPGTDGTVVIASNTSLSRDMYYDTLTVNNGVTLNTNGFKVFVKNTLTVSGTINNTGTTGTLRGVSSVGSGNVSYSIGGSSGGNTYTASALTDGQKKDLISLINGTVTLNDGSIQAITGGAAGANGAVGTVTPAGVGGTGSLNRNPLVPGGPGTAGTTPPAASGGSGGSGGGLILIAAKTIVGSGTISSTGGNATSGGSSATGTAGSTAPNATLSHHVDASADYITGDGTTGPVASTSVPNLPHGGHVPHAYNYRHGYTYHHVHRGNVHHQGCSGDCSYLCGGYSTGTYDHGHNHAGGDYGHHSGDYNNSSHIDSPSLYPTYYSINGINHTPGHRGNIGEARIGHNSHTSGYFHVGHDAPHHGGPHSGGHGGKLPCGAYHIAYAYPRHHWQQNHGTYIERSAGSVSSVGSATKNGGIGGTAGSTTAGGDGITGGGGGIIIVSDSVSETIVTSASGGTGGAGNGSSGSVIKILNI